MIAALVMKDGQSIAVGRYFQISWFQEKMLIKPAKKMEQKSAIVVTLHCLLINPF